ncbi:MAG: transposase [Bacteroidia bacterium]
MHPQHRTRSGNDLLAETEDFIIFAMPKQLVSYATGYDVVQRQSGSSLNDLEKISKKGKYSYIRRIMYMPSLTAPKYIPDFQRLYQRINEKNPQTKMKGSVALQKTPGPGLSFGQNQKKHMTPKNINKKRGLGT